MRRGGELIYLPEDWRQRCFLRQPILHEIVSSETCGLPHEDPRDVLVDRLNEASCSAAEKERIRGGLAEVLRGAWDYPQEAVTAAEVIVLGRSESIDLWRESGVDMTSTLRRLLLFKAPYRYFLLVNLALAISPDALGRVTSQYWGDLRRLRADKHGVSTSMTFRKYAVMVGASGVSRPSQLEVIVKTCAERCQKPGALSPFVLVICEQAIRSLFGAIGTCRLDRTHAEAVLACIPVQWLSVFHAMFTSYLVTARDSGYPDWVTDLLAEYIDKSRT